MVLAFAILMRIKSIESINTLSPGEFGKIIGLDRIPEIRTIREKLEIISKQKNAEKWGEALSKDWIENYNDAEFIYYIDGHIKI